MTGIKATPDSNEADTDQGQDESPAYIDVKTKKPEGYEGSCLRPAGLCTLGGCCDICWYNPAHPRFKKTG